MRCKHVLPNSNGILFIEPQLARHRNSAAGKAVTGFILRPFFSFILALVQWRNMLRLTAKSTQFGRKTFTSWLIESAGTVPIKRRQDFGDQKVDNTMVMGRLMEVSVCS